MAPRILGPRGRRRLAFAAAITLVVVVGAAVLPGWTGRPHVVQPIRFNHAVHLKYNATCDTCHRVFSTGQAAGRPGAAVCSDCHDPAEEPLGDSSEEQVLRAYLDKGEELPWKRLLALPADVRFSHVLHVARGKVPCEQCHGAMGERTEPPPLPLRLFSMEACMACHEERGASNDCMACHR